MRALRLCQRRRSCLRQRLRTVSLRGPGFRGGGAWLGAGSHLQYPARG